MCGICGYVTKNDIKKSALEQMTDLLKHRGPDDRGVWCGACDNYNVGLGHRRLSILDLSPAGHQPMVDESERYVIVFNGEIYNYTELRELVAGSDIKSDADTEVLLYMYIKYGKDCLRYLNGMFAFAVYDRYNNTLFMARDRMGKKPLYYYIDDQQIVFASEIKSIIEFPFFDRKLDNEVLVQYFSQKCILPPRTIFRNTYKLRAGEFIVWADGRIDKESYYSPVDSYKEGQKAIEEDYYHCKKQLKELLYDSVEKRLVADVPVGTFLSGGIDSTLITAIASDIRSDRGLDTFSIGFTDKKYDESSYAAQTAKYLGTRHHERMMSEEDLFDMLDEMTVYYDEPFSDSSQLPTMLVSRFAKENVTVVLSGDGGDELFAGYTNIDTISKLKRLDPILSMVRLMIPEVIKKNVKKDSSRILLQNKRGIEKVQYYAKIRENLAKNLLKDNKYDGMVSDGEIEAVDNWQQQRMLLDMSTYLPDEIMTKTDRASMRFALEMRCPILDYRIVDYSMKIPFEFKYRDGIKKYILKDIVYDYVPREMMDRPKKGFGVPIYRWLKKELNNSLNRFMEFDFVDGQGLFDPEKLNKLYKMFIYRDENSTTQVMWSYYVFQLWYKKYMI